MRSPNDMCLLCNTSKATKENSHIIPKFMGKSLLSNENGNRGYLLDTSKGHLPAKIMQDNAKENYILCPDCEIYFSVLETYIATRLHNRIWSIKFNDQFPTYENSGGIRWRVCTQINQDIFRLFIYSIVWRCSISETTLHRGFKLKTQEELILKNMLKNFHSVNQDMLLETIEKNITPLTNYPFVIYTSQTFKSKTGNTIYTSSFNSNPFVLHLNEYLLLFSFTQSDEMNRFDFLVNNDNSFIKIGFFTEEFWTKGNERFLNIAVQETVKKAKAIGKAVYIDPKIK